MNSKLTVSIVGLLIAGAIGVFLWLLPSGLHTSKPIPMVISRVVVPYSGLVDIAAAKGFFVEEGLAVTLQGVKSGPEAIREVLEAKADVGTAAETPIVRALVSGKPLKIIGTIFNAGDEPGMIARRDHGISRPEDLKGKRIGYVPGTAHHYLLEIFLAFHQIPLADVSIVPMKLDELVTELVSGKLDAATIWNPSFQKVIDQLGDKAQIFSSHEIYTLDFNLFVRPDYLQANREAVERLLSALLKAEKFIRSNPDEAIRIIATASNSETSFIRKYWNPLSYDLTLKQSLLVATENEARWMLRREPDTGKTMPDVFNAFETEALRKLKPSGVGILK